MSVTNVGIIAPWNEATVSAGAEVAADGAIQNKDQRLLNEDFSEDPVNPTVWGTLQAGNGAVDVNIASQVVFTKPVQTDIAAIFLKSIQPDQSNPFRLKFRIQPTVFANAFLVWNFSGFDPEPPLDSLGNIQIFMAVVSATTGYITYEDPSSVRHYWTGAIWTTTFSTISIAQRVWKNVYIIADGTNWKIRLEDEDGSLQTETDTVPWASTKALAGGESAYLILHDNRSSGGPVGVVTADKVEFWNTELATTYLTSAQTCERDPILTDETFNSEDVIVTLDRTPLAATEIQVAIKEDAGSFGADINVNVTPIAGETGRFRLAAGTTFNGHSISVTLRAKLNSPDSNTQLRILSVEIEGITVAAAGNGAIIRSKTAQSLGVKGATI